MFPTAELTIHVDDVDLRHPAIELHLEKRTKGVTHSVTDIYDN